MKKIIIVLCLIALLSCAFLSGADLVVRAEDSQNAEGLNPRDAALAEALIGTWRYDSFWGARIIVFREDGTMLWGSAGAISEYTWLIDNGRVRVPVRATHHFIHENGTLTVYRTGYSRQAQIFTFYSETTDLYEAETGWQTWAVIFLVGAGGVAWAVYAFRKKRAQAKRGETL